MTASLSLRADCKTIPASLEAPSAGAYIFGLGKQARRMSFLANAIFRITPTDFPVFPSHDPADALFA